MIFLSFMCFWMGFRISCSITFLFRKKNLTYINFILSIHGCWFLEAWFEILIVLTPRQVYLPCLSGHWFKMSPCDVLTSYASVGKSFPFSTDFQMISACTTGSWYFRIVFRSLQLRTSAVSTRTCVHWKTGYNYNCYTHTTTKLIQTLFAVHTGKILVQRKHFKHNLFGSNFWFRDMRPMQLIHRQQGD